MRDLSSRTKTKFFSTKEDATEWFRTWFFENIIRDHELDIPTIRERCKAYFAHDPNFKLEDHCFSNGVPKTESYVNDYIDAICPAEFIVRKYDVSMPTEIQLTTEITKTPCVPFKSNKKRKVDAHNS